MFVWESSGSVDDAKLLHHCYLDYVGDLLEVHGAVIYVDAVAGDAAAGDGMVVGQVAVVVLEFDVVGQAVGRAWLVGIVDVVQRMH